MMMDFNIPTRVLTALFIKAINVVVSHVYTISIECIERIDTFLFVKLIKLFVDACSNVVNALY